MPTTTNYGWTTPADTDLVKDGAAAIRTLGNSVDTTTKALNPETTLGDLAYRSATSNTNTRLPIGSAGQVLTVASGVPSWATPTDQTPLTTKGDLFTFSTVDARLGVGTNGTVLTADSAEATGLKWATPAAAGFVGVSLTRTGSDPSFSNNTDTVIEWDSETYDTDNFHSTVTNPSRITIPAGKGGYYFVYAKINFKENATGARQISIYKNSTLIRKFVANSSGSAERHLQISSIINLSATDQIEIYALQASGGTLGGYTGATNMEFIAQFVGA